MISYNIPVFGTSTTSMRRKTLRSRRRLVVSEHGVREIPELNISDLVIDSYHPEKGEGESEPDIFSL